MQSITPHVRASHGVHIAPTRDDRVQANNKPNRHFGSSSPQRDENRHARGESADALEQHGANGCVASIQVGDRDAHGHHDERDAVNANELACKHNDNTPPKRVKPNPEGE